MRIGQLVKAHVTKIFTYCDRIEHEEFLALLDADYSKRKFGINFPFCICVEDIDSTLSKRYWTEVYLVRGRRVRVTSQWYETNRPLFVSYLKTKGIELRTESDDVKASSSPSAKKNETARSSRSNSRYRGNAIGNAQNLFIRNILSRLGNESFSEKDWEETKEYFLNKCAYCGAETELVIEHAIPINKEKLGEHRLGNLVPSCRSCNSKKASQDFREFLGSQIEPIRRIEEYMDSRDYVPLEDNTQMRMILDMAYKEVSTLADRYIRIINELFPQSFEDKPDSDDI
jgi:5-methylcytosine-specific restriction endonuclease McrA